MNSEKVLFLHQFLMTLLNVGCVGFRLFKDCPHPDEKQRLQLSRELGLAPRQIKFWFQNRRTQMKVLLFSSNGFVVLLFCCCVSPCCFMFVGLFWLNKNILRPSTKGRITARSGLRMTRFAVRTLQSGKR